MRGNDSAQGVDSGCRKSTPFPKYATFNGRLVILGFGSIGQGSLPLVLRHLDMEGKQVTILVPRDCPTSQAAERIAPEYGVNIVFARLTPDNYIDILTPLLAKGDFLLNVSVDVSSLDLIRFCNPRGVFYIDTCVEPWAGGYSSSDVSLADRSNYALREQALALKRQLASPTSTTAISCLGANPGLVSLFVKQALLNVAADTGVKMAERPRSRVAWAKLAQQLGIKAIHIAERDTQYCLQRKKKGEFVNTWSVDGFISEGCFQPSELGWGTHEKQLPVGGHHHTSGCGSAIYIDKPGSLVQVRTWTPLEGAFHGFLVTHNEAISISDALTVRSDDVEDQEEEVEVVPADDVSSSDDADDASSVSSADDEEVEKKASVVAPAPAPAPTSSSSSSSKVVYRPTVHYAYMPCDDAILSLREMAGNNFTEPAEKRLIVDDVVGGKDELGVLLLGHAKGAYWYGSQLDVLRARELVPHNSATTLQVTSTILGGMVWALNNPTAGVVEADDIMDFDALLDIAKPYCEPVVGVYSDWTPLKDRHVDLFPDDVDHTDPFQFKNIIV